MFLPSSSTFFTWFSGYHTLLFSFSSQPFFFFLILIVGSSSSQSVPGFNPQTASLLYLHTLSEHLVHFLAFKTILSLVLPKYICISGPVFSSNSSRILLTACLSPLVCMRDISNLNVASKITLFTFLHISTYCPFLQCTTTIFLTSLFVSHPVQNLSENFYGSVFQVGAEFDHVSSPLPLPQSGLPLPLLLQQPMSRSPSFSLAPRSKPSSQCDPGKT